MPAPLYAMGSSPQSSARARVSSAEMAAAPALNDLRVVIVEDEAITQMQLKMILTRQGVHIVGTGINGDQGVDLARAHQPDMILMDIKMATNTDGLDATRRILSERETCVVMLTAYEEFREEAERIGACGYVIKPIDSITLIPQLVQAYRRFRDSHPGLIQ